jgi:hypothetical protein
VIRAITVVAAISAVIVAFGLVGQADYEDAKAQHERYCEMVELYHETGGTSGWPPYDGECKDQ